MGPLHLIFVSEGASSSGVPRAVKRAGGWGRTQAPCGLPLTPYTGDIFWSIRYFGQSGLCMSAISGAGVLGLRSRGHRVSVSNKGA